MRQLVGRIIRTMVSIYRRLPAPLREAVGGRLRTFYAERLVSAISVPSAVPTDKLDNSLPWGVGLFGYFEAESGVGESVRSALRALRAVGIPVVPINVRAGAFANRDQAIAVSTDRVNPHLINLLHLNADQTILLPNLVDERNLKGRYSIGYWAWELAEFPNSWSAAFGALNEIWVPSNFVRDSLRAKTEKPVFVIPHAIKAPAVDGAAARAKLGIPPNAFMFLCAFDYNSFVTRKNPGAAVEAFVRAFPEAGSGPDVRLVVKAHGGQMSFSRERSALMAILEDDPRIMLIDEVMSRDGLAQLQAASNAFVSLHRSEGFGLNIAECMAAGKVVIATDYSGSTDFVSADCAMPIGYKLVPVGRNEYPFGDGQHWADPDVAEAAAAMKRVVESDTLCRKLGDAARTKVLEGYNERVVGAIMSTRLAEIRSLVPRLEEG